jgi:hypothetical protein
MKDSFYEDIERVLDQFPKYHMNILLGDFTGILGRELSSNRQYGTIVYMNQLNNYQSLKKDSAPWS